VAVSRGSGNQQQHPDTSLSAGRLPLKAHLGSKTYRSRVSPHVTPSSSLPSACRWYPLVHHIRSSWLSLLVTVLTILHPIKPLYAFSRRILASERERKRKRKRGKITTKEREGKAGVNSLSRDALISRARISRFLPREVAIEMVHITHRESTLLTQSVEIFSREAS